MSNIREISEDVKEAFQKYGNGLIFENVQVFQLRGSDKPKVEVLPKGRDKLSNVSDKLVKELNYIASRNEVQMKVYANNKTRHDVGSNETLSNKKFHFKGQ